MLRGVVSDQGTAELAAIPGYAVAGKTGTAQKPGPNGYIPGAYVATFVGMVPASTAAPPRARDDRRAARADLRRPRRGSRLRADRLLRPPVPGGSARPADQVGGSLPGTLAAGMDLERLVAALEPVEVLGGPSVEVRDLAYDARAVGPGALFFAVPGARADGHDFAPEAVERGAVALVVERRARPARAAGRRARRARGDGARRGRVLRRADPGARGASASPARAGRRRRASSCSRSSPPPAGAPACSGRSRRASAASGAASCGRRPRRSTCSVCSARCSTPATARARWRPRRTRPFSTGWTASASPCWSSRISARITSTSTATWSRTSRRSGGSSSSSRDRSRS